MQTGFGLCVLLVALWAGIIGPAHSEETWKAVLEQQLIAEEKCQLNYLTDVSVTESAGVKARAHCEDSRSFDVHMPPDKAKFAISACKPTYC